jgi:hypothetical protein
VDIDSRERRLERTQLPPRMPPRRPLLLWPVQQATLDFGWQLPEDAGACSIAGMAETATALARMAKMVENCILIEVVVLVELKRKIVLKMRLLEDLVGY